jgi:hypothetical protein
MPNQGQAPAGVPDDFREKFCRDSVGVTKPAGEAMDGWSHSANIFGGEYEFESNEAAIA